MRSTITITEGNGFLVFPDYLHAVKPISENSSEYITLIFDPSLLYGYHDSFFEKEFYTPLSTSGNAFLLLNANQTWVKQIFLEIRWMDEHYPTSSSKTMYRIQQNLQRLWISLSEHSNIYFKDDHLDQNNQKIFSMLNYIQRNYADKFSLSDMADACHVSRGECCRYFKKLMHMKILDYLTEYRIRKAIELLENTELSITEIAHGTGFGTASYFITILDRKSVG